MMRSRKSGPIFALFFWLAASLPAQTPVWKGKIVSEGAVTVVRNPKLPMYPAGSLQLKQELKAEIDLPFTVMAFRSDKIYSREFDAGGYLVLKRYALIWKK